MRKLMWFAIGFAAACAAGVYLVSGLWLLLLAVFSLICMTACWFVKAKHSRICAVALLGCTVGLIWLWGFDALYLADARSYDTQTVETVITVSDYSCETGYGVAADGKIHLQGKSYNVRLYLNEEVILSPGDRITGSFRLRYTADGGERPTAYYQGKGTFLLAYAKGDVHITYSEAIPHRYYAAVLRSRITGLLDALFPEDAVGFARALLLGDSSLLSYEEDTAFSVSGIRHVIAVSGLHVSILFSLIYTFSGKRKAVTAVLGIPVLVVFAAVAGFTPSIVRACVMQILMILALLLNKEYDPPTALSFAVLVLLAVNPLCITSVSFQLSVGCMVGIFLFSGRIREYLYGEKRLGAAKGNGIGARLKRWVVESVSVTLSAMAVTTPLCACYFGMVSLVGVLTNLVTLWMISFIFYGIMAACILGAVWLPLGSAAAWTVSWPIRLVQLIAKVLSSFPLAAVYTSSVYIVMWLVVCYVLLAAFLRSKQKHPALLAGCMAVCLCVAMAASWAEPRLDDYRVTVMDVGQGQCILLQNSGRYYLVDCGGDNSEDAADTAAQLLLSQGVSRLDGVILTHYDTDHAGGVQMLLSRIPADRLYLPDTDEDNSIRKMLTQMFSDKIDWIPADTQVGIPKADITLFSAQADSSDNESSLCILFQPENCDILITGDRNAAGEKALMAQTELPELELLVVGHHGSDSSTCLELLQGTTPAAAVISVGENNSYGHPSQQTLDRLELFGCQVLRTDIDGTVVFGG